MDYHRQHKVDIRIARIFNTYGPNMAQDDGRVVSNFILQALRDEPITVYGDGSQTRSFCYVDDLIRGLISLFFKESVHAPINIGNPDEINVTQLATEIVAMTNSKSLVSHHPLPQDDPRIRKPDITLAKEILNWEPSVSREEGLRATIAYFESTI
jgi:UDP-glucuronate decarboxylase